MTTSQNKQNWFYILLGLLFFLPSILNLFVVDKSAVEESELVTKTLILKNNIQEIKYWKDRNAFQFYSTEDQCLFVIEKGVRTASNSIDLDNLDKGDTIFVNIHKNSLVDLTKKTEKIPIYSIQKNGRQIYDVASYNNTRKTYEGRWRIVFLIFGVLITIRGLNIISSKTAYILAGISILITIITKICNIW